MSIQPFETAEAHASPVVRQQSVFIENRVGQLLRLTRLFEQSDVRILAVSVVHSVDCAICRFVLDDADAGSQLIRRAGLPACESELLVVSLPHGKRALLDTWAALLGGEVNIHYTYPLLIHPQGSPAIAVACDNLEQGVRVLRERGFTLLDEADLRDTRQDL